MLEKSSRRSLQWGGQPTQRARGHFGNFYCLALTSIIVILLPLSSFSPTYAQWVEAPVAPHATKALEKNRDIMDAFTDGIADCPDYFVLPRSWQSERFVLTDCLRFTKAIDLPISDSGCPVHGDKQKTELFEAGSIFGVWRWTHYDKGDAFCAWLTPAAVQKNGRFVRYKGILNLNVALPRKLESYGIKIGKFSPPREPIPIRRLNPHYSGPEPLRPRIELRRPLIIASMDAATPVSERSPDRGPYIAPPASRPTSERFARSAKRDLPIDDERRRPPVSLDHLLPDSEYDEPWTPESPDGPDTAMIEEPPAAEPSAPEMDKDATVQVCTTQGKPLAEIPSSLITASRANYVASLKPLQPEKIFRFRAFGNDYYDDGLIDNPLRKAGAAIVPVRSLKSYNTHKMANGEVRTAHIGEIELPEDLSPADGPSLKGAIRIIASPRALELIKPRVLAKLMKRRENKNFDLKIVFDRILPEGKLAESETLTNFSELAERARNTPLRLDETEFGNLLEKVAERLKSSDYAFDHLIIAKENWNAPLNAASSVIEVLNAGEARGKTGSWLSIYSKFTAAHGNSFLSAAVNRSGGGRLFSERAKKTENPIPRRLQFLSALRGTVQNRALREELAGAKKKPARKVTIDLNSVTEPNGTGHLIAREQMSQFRKKLQLLLDRLKYDTDRDTGDGGLSLGEYFLKADPPFIKLPATAPVRYRRRNPLSAMTKDEIRTFNRNLTKLLNSRGFTSPKRCAAYFLRDKDLGADGL